MQGTSLQRICDWVTRINHQPDYLQKPFYDNDRKSVINTIIMLSNDTAKTEPYFSKELFEIKDLLFVGMFINPIGFGRLVEILNYLWSKQTNHGDAIWDLIHPKIIYVSKELFLNGHYANASEDAFIEINDRVKKIYIKLEPNKPTPDGQDVMNKVFADGDKALIEVCDRSTDTGRNIHEGTRFMLAGAMAALRNPKAHSNSAVITKEECVRRLMFASMLMYKIDEAVAYSGITE